MTLRAPGAAKVTAKVLVEPDAPVVPSQRRGALDHADVPTDDGPRGRDRPSPRRLRPVAADGASDLDSRQLLGAGPGAPW